MILAGSSGGRANWIRDTISKLSDPLLKTAPIPFPAAPGKPRTTNVNKETQVKVEATPKVLMDQGSDRDRRSRKRTRATLQRTESATTAERDKTTLRKSPVTGEIDVLGSCSRFPAFHYTYVSATFASLACIVTFREITFHLYRRP